MTDHSIGAMKEPEDHNARVAVARRLAAWEIGSPSWANRIIDAYFNPDATREYLNREQDR